jgi:phosphoesterase RecJ-like protein
MLEQEQQIFAQIKKAENILITFKGSRGGDAISSALALHLLIKKMGKKTTLVAENQADNHLFNFLPDFDKIKKSLDMPRDFIISLNTANAKIGQVKYKVREDSLDFIVTPKQGWFSADDIESKTENFPFDLIIVLDTPDLDSIGKIHEDNAEFFYKTPIINIDHHSNNENFGQINNIELTATSTAEIIFKIASEQVSNLIDEDIATCLLSGIIAETKSFKMQNITPQALTISSQLVAMGARREEIVNRLYRSRSLNILKLWGRVLARLNSASGSGIIWSVLAAHDFEKTESSEKDLNEIIDELIINIPQAKIVVLIYEKTIIEQNGQKKIAVQALVYSLKNVNILHMLGKFNPKGTANFAKFILDAPLAKAENEIIEHLKNELNKLPD